MGWVDPCPRKNKNGYYQSFKTWFGGRLEVRPESLARLIVNTGQYKDKNGYYHSFETRINQARVTCQDGKLLGST